MYSVLSYGAMACDRVRMDAHARAVSQAVTPGSVVLDIGAGTGILSLLAARAGAKEVHAVDPNPAIHLLPEIASANGFGDRIQVHPISVFDLELPQKVDVIISDLRGSFPLHGRHTEILRDARTRLLRPNGLMVPSRDTLFVAVVETPEIIGQLGRAAAAFESYGFDARVALHSVVNTKHRDSDLHPIHASDVITDSSAWATIDYGEFAGGTIECEMSLTATRNGVAHGLAIWFDALLIDGVGFTNAPGHSTSYARIFLPLEAPVALQTGARVHVTLRVDERGERWAWDTRFESSAGAAGTIKAFRQATFLGAPTSAQALLRSASTFHPERSALGDKTMAVLRLMDGHRSTLQIADETKTSVDVVRETVSLFAK